LLDIGALTLGYARGIGRYRSLPVTVAAQGAVRFLPEELSLFYGSRNPLGVAIGLNIRPE